MADDAQTTILKLRARLDERDKEIAELRRQAAQRSRELHEQERRLPQIRALADALPPLLAYVDASERYRFNNRGYEQWFGRPSDAIVGRTVADLLGAEAYAKVKPRIDGVLRGETQRFQERMVGQDAGPRDVEIVYVPDGDPFEGVRGYFVMVHDVTERVRAQKALRESEERFRRAAESAGAVVYDIDLRGEGKFIVHGLERLTGLTPDQIRLDAEWWKSRIHPEDAPTYFAELEAQLKRGGVMKASFRILHASGAWLHVESSREVLLDQEEKVVRLVGAMVDVSYRMSADAALRESEERLRLALAAGQMGAWDVDLATGRIRWDAKEFALLGFPDGSVPPSPQAFYQHVHPDDHALIRQAVQRAVERTGDMDYEFRVIHPDGEIRWLAARGQVLKDDQGRAVRIVGVNYDVTQRKRMEERLRSFTLELEWRVAERTRELVQSQDRLRALATELNLTEQRERKRLATDLHDYLAQLLALVRMKLGQLRRMTPASSQGEMVAEAEKVVNEALTYTRTLVTQLSPPVLHEFGLPVALKWLSQQMVRQELSVEVRQSVPDHLAVPEDQAVLLFQSVRELLVNVRKHAGTHKAVVTIEQQRGELVIAVHDEGRGSGSALTATAQPTATSSKFGLFSIRERMLAIGGRFAFESSPEKGTTATLTLPLGGGAAASETRVTSETGGTGRGSALESRPMPVAPLSLVSQVPQHARIRVLLVDDHMMVREGLRGLLKEHDDVEVVGEAWDGEEAVAFADRLRPDVIIMDVNMPRLDGLEATRRIKAAFRSIAVIGLSVNSSSQVEMAMRSSGADAFLSKDAAGEQVYLTVREMGKR